MLWKRMKKKIFLFPLALLLLSAFAAPVLAQKELVGVQVGDWFKYEARVTQWVSDMEFLQPGYLGPLSLYENETNAIWYNVTAITPDTEGDNVTFTIQYDWKNGSITTATMVETISTADQMIFMIGANMTVGAMVSDTFDFLDMGVFQYPARYINETTDLVNPNATRATNVLDYDINILGADYHYLFYWDKATGMRVYYENHGVVPEIDFGTGTPQPAYTYTVVWELVDSNVNGVLVPDLTGPILLLTSIAITIPIVIMHRRRKAIQLK
jgi:hypothetical protein